MAKLKLNEKIEFVYIENNAFLKLDQELEKYQNHKVLFVIDTVSQKGCLNISKKHGIKPVFYQKQCTNDTASQSAINIELINDGVKYIKQNEMWSHLQDVTLIIANGDDDNINIAKTISAKFGLPYILLLDKQNNCFCFSHFYIDNLQVKKGFLPLGVVCEFSEKDFKFWQQKLLIQKSSVFMFMFNCFLDGVFLDKTIKNISEELNDFLNKNMHQKTLKDIIEDYIDICLLIQNHEEYFSLFLLNNIYKTITNTNYIISEFFIYKILIKMYSVFVNNFLSKYNALKFINDNDSIISSKYVYYVLKSFSNKINDKICFFESELNNIEDLLNKISTKQTFEVKQIMNSKHILSSIKIFCKIQKSPTFLTLIDFYNLF